MYQKNSGVANAFADGPVMGRAAVESGRAMWYHYPNTEEGVRNMIQYRRLGEGEICRALFRGFRRRQVVTKCWRRENGAWVIRDDPFVDDWSEADYETMVSCLKNTVVTGGVVFAAFMDGALKGFASVEGTLFGGENRYLDLTSIHVSEEARGSGIGSALFRQAKEWAREHGAEKLYISAHSAVESQGFYRRMGCVEAQEYSREHTEAEPFDCQMECALNEAAQST